MATPDTKTSADAKTAADAKAAGDEKVPADAKVSTDAKTAAETKKIELEIKILQRQLSVNGRILQWLQAGGILAVVVTLFVGLEQLRVTQETSSAQIEQIAQNRATDRFDKAIGRLADRTSPSARVAGVTGLRLLLGHADPSEQKAALRYLITAVLDEKSPDVLHAITDTFGDSKSLDPDARNDALSVVIEMDRSLTKDAAESYLPTMTARGAALSKSPPLDDDFFPKDTQTNRELDFEKLVRINTAFKVKLFHDLHDHNSDQAIDNNPAFPTYVKIINALIAAGAVNTSKDWSDLYCQGCNFANAVNKDMNHSRFERSFLESADFSRVDLSYTIFTDADLAQTMFFASNLTSAHLNWSEKRQAFLASQTNQTRNSGTRVFPFLECATLKGADIGGLPLVTIKVEIGHHGDAAKSFIRQSIQFPSLRHSKIDAYTKINRLGLHVKVSVNGAFLYGLNDQEKTRLEEGFLKPLFDWPEPIVNTQFDNLFQRKDIVIDRTNEKEPVRDLVSNNTVQIYEVESVGESIKSLLLSLQDEPLFSNTPVTEEIIRLAREANNTTKHDKQSGKDVDCQQQTTPDEDSLQVWVPGD